MIICPLRLSIALTGPAKNTGTKCRARPKTEGEFAFWGPNASGFHTDADKLNDESSRMV